ncbi:MAG: hypothetical protein KJ060_00055 [Candidatus Hydrogenedentes bacterium]|nr:hypothetical protein [Candidatus Hydrogenedentota bacterium]
MPSTPRSHPNTFRALTSYWADSNRIDDLLTREEHDFVAVAVREFRRRFGDVNPTVVMRIEGVIMLYVLARRAGLAALRAGLAPTDTNRPQKDGKTSAADDVCKAHDHLRKAVKDLEDATGDGETAVAQGVADLLRPLLKDTEGLAESLANEDREAGSNNGLPSRRRDSVAARP